jgi:hypothetical protein
MAFEIKILDHGDIELESSFLVISGGDSAMTNEFAASKSRLGHVLDLASRLADLHCGQEAG